MLQMVQSLYFFIVWICYFWKWGEVEWSDVCCNVLWYDAMKRSDVKLKELSKISHRSKQKFCFVTLEFSFATRNPPQTIPTGHPSTPHEPKLERHRASAGLREAFCRERPGDGGSPVYTLCASAPGPRPG